MNWIEFGLIAIVGLVSLWAFRRTGALEKEIAFVRRRSQSELDDMTEEIVKLQSELRRVRAIVRTGGALRFTPDLKIEELDDLHPDALAVLATFHIGGCQSCAVEGDDTLGAAIREKGANEAQVLAALNALVEPDSGVRDDLARIGAGGLLQIQTKP
jgi:hypothetical protein